MVEPLSSGFLRDGSLISGPQYPTAGTLNEEKSNVSSRGSNDRVFIERYSKHIRPHAERKSHVSSRGSNNRVSS